MGDGGYDAEGIRQGLRDRRIIPFLAKRNTEHGGGLDRWRWVVERTFAWLNQLRRLRVRYERPADSRGISLLGVCFDLLALPASRLGGRLKVSFARSA
jgi:transposase